MCLQPYGECAAVWLSGECVGTCVRDCIGLAELIDNEGCLRTCMHACVPWNGLHSISLYTVCQHTGGFFVLIF